MVPDLSILQEPEMASIRVFVIAKWCILRFEFVPFEFKMMGLLASIYCETSTIFSLHSSKQGQNTRNSDLGKVNVDVG